MEEIKLQPKEIFEEYKSGVTYKASIGAKGIYEQAKINERFFVGDQWYGANVGNDRPLVRRNIIKRIGEYKIATVGAAPIAVNYSADGIPDTTDLSDEKEKITESLYNNSAELPQSADEAEISVIMSALSDYFSISAERVKFNNKIEQALRNAYISGTGLLYTYWDNNIKTGLYADEGKTKAIRGDISCEVLDVENVNFGDPNCDDVESQPFIIVSQRVTVSAAKREAKLFKGQYNEIKPDKADTYNTNAGTRGEEEPSDSQRVTVLTKFYKKYDEHGDFKIWAIKVTENAVIRKEWELKTTRYPIAKFCWERRRSCSYGDSEVTYLIPNQIAINRALSAAVWAMMSAGMPKLLYNSALLPEDTVITNDPGEIIGIEMGQDFSVHNAFMYLQPPNFAGQFENLVNDMASNTLSDSGANDAALGDIRPDNAAAIIQMREAALQPMQIYQNRFYDFVEDIAKIWADMWIGYYGDRHIKTKTKEGVKYIHFDAERYKNLVINATVDVGAAPLWSISATISNLNYLFANGIINKIQYLERVPNGAIPDKTGLLEEFKQEQAMQQGLNDSQQVLNQFKANHPAEYEQFSQLPPEVQETELAKQLEGATV